MLLLHKHWQMRVLRCASSLIKVVAVALCLFSHFTAALFAAGVDAIQGRQEAIVSQHVIFSATAAFIAGVAATALQYGQLSANATDGGQNGVLINHTVTLWYYSLVLAIFSAMFSLLLATVVRNPKCVVSIPY